VNSEEVYLFEINRRTDLMKKIVKVSLHLILAGIVSVISFIGFKKAVEALNEKMEKNKSE
jgi:EamA domain-containing membrane protein RarD